MIKKFPYIMGGECELCYRTFSGTMYQIYILKDLKNFPERTWVCDNCIKSKRFYFLFKDGSIRFNFVETESRSVISQSMEKA